MKVFMLANVPKAWVVTMKGPYVPMNIVGEREVPKEEIDWNDEDLEKIMINNKAINMLQCALNPTKFHRVSGCDTAKEMWDMLEVTHEGTSQVKESKINRLIYMYELFKMKPEESIQVNIVTNLKALAKVYPPQEVVRKVLRSLPKSWEAKKTAIEESKDLNTLKLEDLIGKLMTYEIEVQGRVATTLFVKNKGQDILIVQIYVDDIVVGATNDFLCQEFSKAMQGEFEMSMMGELNFFLGLQIKQSKEGIFINQSKYTKEMLKKFGMETCKPIVTPMSTSINLDKDEGGKPIDPKLYRSMIGSLLYLTASRPDIMFSVCLCARFQACPKESHLIAVKRVFRPAEPVHPFSQPAQPKTREYSLSTAQPALASQSAQPKKTESSLSKPQPAQPQATRPRPALQPALKRVNLGRYIFRSIIKPYSPTTGLPYGALITRLAKRNNIDFTSFRFGTVPGGTTLTKASFEKMDCLFRNGFWIKKGEQDGDQEEGGTDQEMAEQGAEEHEDDSPRPFQVSMQRTNRETMELMISEMQQLHTDFYGFRTEMRGRMTNVEGKLDRLVNHFFPPPTPDAI
ncbi:hypothetical protein SLEP1_g3397 [Rubroshorea leprosula]|uniref:Reverse transcriptase Ty1/copia-type domain-containing protein n=1 Tax=Rubroshorea leprosula TaxID=152421 RepID=A0AAV5HPK5_9ROSI|nr:hypothetical protein SLEP1_g3397 [Rubroshorea leprosula]